MPVLRIVTQIAAPPELCFDLSRSIDLHLESMLASGERAVDGVTGGLIGLGEEVTWEARHFGRMWRMTSRITEFDRPSCFVDEMVTGPFAAFRHEHRFEADGPGTRMDDTVSFEVGGGLLGLVGPRVVGAYLRRLLRVRNQAIRRWAEQD